MPARTVTTSQVRSRKKYHVLWKQPLWLHTLPIGNLRSSLPFPSRGKLRAIHHLDVHTSTNKTNIRCPKIKTSMMEVFSLCLALPKLSLHKGSPLVAVLKRISGLSWRRRRIRPALTPGTFLRRLGRHLLRKYACFLFHPLDTLFKVLSRRL